MLEIEEQIPISLERAARFDPFCPVHWRWDLAQQIASGQVANPGPMTSRLKSVVDYLRRRAAGQTLNNDEDSKITAALELFESDTPFRWELEARLLTGESDADISQKMGVAVEITATFEWLFFAVRNCRHATGYLLDAVVRYAHLRGFQNHEVRALWAWSAMAGGPLIVDLMVQIFHSARREGELPSMKVYLRRGACDLLIQTFIAIQVIPPEANALWICDLSTKLQVAKTSASPIAENQQDLSCPGPVCSPSPGIRQGSQSSRLVELHEHIAHQTGRQNEPHQVIPRQAVDCTIRQNKTQK